jgi:predicted aspartyl protease
MIDTGAGGTIFIDRRFAERICRFLSIQPIPLEHPCPVRGYNGKAGDPITNILVLHLSIDGRRQYDVPLLILDLGRHNMIFGLKWLEQHDIWLNISEQRLIWPDQRDAEVSLTREICTSDSQLLDQRTDPAHQADVYFRDEAFDLEDRQRAAGRASKPPTPTVEDSEEDAVPIQEIHPLPPTPPPTPPPETPKVRQGNPGRGGRSTSWIKDREDRQAMERELRSVDTTKAHYDAPVAHQDWEALEALRKKPKEEPIIETPEGFDICLIGGISMARNLRNPKHEAFAVTIYEIDRVIEDKKLEQNLREQDEDKVDNELLEQLLPEVFHTHKDVFSKRASDTLPPHRKYDHKIELEKENTLGYTALYKQSLPELEATRKYLLENLDKGFIDHSHAPFASPVLFVRKANRSLRFCIDYR